MIRWLLRLVLLGAAVLLVTAASVFLGAVLMQQRHSDGRSLSEPVEAAIVLGAGVNPDGKLGYSTQRRVAAGVDLLRAGLAERLVMSGRIVGSNVAKVMRETAFALGAPGHAVVLEDESETTFQNIRFSFAMARRNGWDSLAILTDDYHLLRAWALACYFGRCDVGLVAAPTMGVAPENHSAREVGRETLAWWFNVLKIAAWSALGAAGVPESRRELVVK